MYVHFNNLFHMLKNLQYVVVHAVQVDDDLGMRHDMKITLVYIQLSEQTGEDMRNSQMSFTIIGDNCIQLDMRF